MVKYQSRSNGNDVTERIGHVISELILDHAYNDESNISTGYSNSPCPEGTVLKTITNHNTTESYSECLNITSVVSTPTPLVGPAPLWQMIVFGTVAGFLCLMTILGNLIVILSFIIERAIRQPTNYFIASLACSDLLIGAISMPFFTVYLLTNNWLLGEFLCDLWLSCDYTVCLTSIYTVFCITIDRFCMVKIPARYRAWRTENKVLGIIALTWIVPTGVFFTSIFGWQYFVGIRTVKSHECQVQYMEEPLFNAVLQICYFWVTLVVMISLYAGIYKVALDMHRKSQAKKNKMTSLVSMAGHTMTKIGIGMSQQKPIATKNLLPPEAVTNTCTNTAITGMTVSTRVRGASMTSFSSSRGDRDERSSSPAYPSDSDHICNSPGRQNSKLHKSKDGRGKKKSSIKVAKITKYPLRKSSKSVYLKTQSGSEMKTERENADDGIELLENDGNIMDKNDDNDDTKAVTAETVALLSGEAVITDSSRLNQSSGFLSNVSIDDTVLLANNGTQDTSFITVDKYNCDNSDGILTTNKRKALIESQRPCAESMVDVQTCSAILESNCAAKTIHNVSNEPVADSIKRNSDIGLTRHPIGCQTMDSNMPHQQQNNTEILQGLQYIDQDFLKSLQSNEGIKLINDIKLDNLQLISTNEPNRHSNFESHGSGTTSCYIQSPLWKRRHSCLLQENLTLSNGVENTDQLTTNNLAQGCVQHTITNTESKKHSRNNSDTIFQYPCNGTNALHHKVNALQFHNGVIDCGDNREEMCQASQANVDTKHCKDLTDLGINTTGNINNLICPVPETSVCSDISKGRVSLPELALNQCNLSSENNEPTEPARQQNKMSPDANRVMSPNRDSHSLNGTNNILALAECHDQAVDKSHRSLYDDTTRASDAILPPPPPPPSYSEAVNNQSNNQQQSAETKLEQASNEKHTHVKDKTLLSPCSYQKNRTTSTDSFERSTSSSYNSKASENQGEITQEIDKAEHKVSFKNKSNRKVKHRKRNGSAKGPLKTLMNASRRKRFSKENEKKQQSKSENRARKALRTITIILGAFVICWTPWHILSMMMGFGLNVPMLLYNISYWLCYLNSPINPFCYAFANQQFKKTFLRILRFDWHKT